MDTTYTCSKCGMSVHSQCAKCNEPLLNDIININHGSQVQVSYFTICEGKIKYPICCVEDMYCTL